MFFTKIGGSFWFRGRVCGRRLPEDVSFIFIVMAVQRPTGVQKYALPENAPCGTNPSSYHLQVIHQLHRAVLDCGIESYIEKVAWINDFCLAPIMCLRLPPSDGPDVISSLTNPTATHWAAAAPLQQATQRYLIGSRQVAVKCFAYFCRRLITTL